MNDTLRYERKFRIEHEHVGSVMSILASQPALFREVYSERWINNIYLDDQLFSAVSSNVAGLAERKKLRVRWYGDLEGQIDRPVLEYKMRHGVVGSKASFPMPPCRIPDDAAPPRFAAIARRADLPDDVRLELLKLRPVLLNRYRRRYFLSADGRFRATVDTCMTFHRAPAAGGRLSRAYADEHAIVLELKYKPEDDDEARHIASGFPFRITRNSKYVHGMTLAWPVVRATG